MERRLPLGPLLGALGAVLLIVSLFLDWYDGVTGFTVFEALDLVLVALALLAIASLAGGLGIIRPPVSPGGTLIGALLTIVIVLSQLVNDPPAVARGGPDHATGIWLAVGGAALMVIGALLAWAHISLAVDVRPRAAGAPGGDGPAGDAAAREAPGRDAPAANAAGGEATTVRDVPPERP